MTNKNAPNIVPIIKSPILVPLSLINRDPNWVSLLELLTVLTKSRAIAFYALRSTIQTGENIVETLMQWISEPLNPRVIDDQIGDLRGQLLSDTPLLTYARFNAVLTQEWIQESLGFSISDLPLTFHPVATRASVVDTPFGAG